MAEKATTNALPRLPGYDFSALTQPVSFNKAQGFTFVQGTPIVKSPTEPVSQVSVDPIFNETAILSLHPGWKTLTNKVLRFPGYFTERVEESAVERMRVRKVVVLFYLVDGTICVNETPAVLNSGLRAGTFMSRHVEKNLGPGGLVVGGTIFLRSRLITLVDCDAATREFYKKMGRPQPNAIDYPPDSFEALQNQPKNVPDQDQIDMRRVTEMMAATQSGKHSTMMSPEERLKAQMFLKHDRDVLNFFASWNALPFRINFFVADGTMSVSALHTPNDGRDPNAQFLKRGLIPKGQYTLKSIDTVSAPRNARVEYFTDLDLRTGTTLTLFGREFFLYDCDGFTREYYRRVHDILQETFPQPEMEGSVRRKAAIVQPPPPTGFGTDEDSLGSFKSIVMKAPKKDYAKYISHANDVLRFGAELAAPEPEDVGRSFIVCFYLADDTVSVYEYTVRNSGHNGGKIFSRAKVPEITPENLIVGATVKLGGYTYVLTMMDDRTQKFLETGASMGTTGNTKAEELVDRVRHCLTQRFSRVTEAYRHFNVSKNGLGLNDVKNMLRELEIKVSDESLLVRFMEVVDRDRDGVISLQEFVENILKQALTTKLPEPGAPLEKSYAELQEEKSRKEFGDKVLKMFIAKLEARRAFIVDTFRIVSDRSVDGLVGVDTFKQVVVDRLGLNLTEDELDALVYRFYFQEGRPDYLSRRLSLKEFRKVLDQ